MQLDLGVDQKKTFTIGAAARACNPWDKAPHTGVRLRLHSVWPGKRGRETPGESGGARAMTSVQKSTALRSATPDRQQPELPASIPAGGRRGSLCSQS